MRWAALSAIGLVLVLVGAFVDPSVADLGLVARDRRRIVAAAHRRTEHGLGPEPGAPVASDMACS